MVVVENFTMNFSTGCQQYSTQSDVLLHFYGNLRIKSRYQLNLSFLEAKKKKGKTIKTPR